MSDKDKPDNRTHAQRRIAERQEAMREFLSARGYLEQIEADLSRELGSDELQAVKFKTETRLKLLAKILPDLRAAQDVNVGGQEDGVPVQTAVRVIFGTD
jgi:hypothetical protein